MQQNNINILNATMSTPEGRTSRKGGDMAAIKTVSKAAIAIRDGIIRYAGSMEEMPAELKNENVRTIDAGGRAVLPGFVDSHTHLIFGGFRPDEFEWRMKGDTYMSIMERGGGIQSTVNATRTLSQEELEERAQWFINRMSHMGVTTVEAKSGYGLDTETELKMLKAIDSLRKKEGQSVEIVPTFLGAHAIPTEYKGRTADYIDHIIKEMLPLAKDYARFCDVFCEKNVFELEDSERLLRAAADAGYELKLHADEIVTLGGAELAAKVGAVSADHLLHVSDRGIEDMSKSGVVATLLPLTAFSLKEPYAPARKFIDRGCAVALATDLNPGSCLSGSIPLTIALACIYMNMSIEETLTALTINGAAAVGQAEKTGTLEAGKRGDVIILHFDNYRMLPYYVGMNCVKTVISHGRIVAEND